MIDSLPTITMPRWLREILDDPEQRRDYTFGLKDILTDSVYYPACRLDVTPIKPLAGNVYSFVYVDYMALRNQAPEDLNVENISIKGYERIHVQDIVYADIIPVGWEAPLQPSGSDEDLRKMRNRKRRCRPFTYWSVWKRSSDFGEEHGPDGLSLLYVGGEACEIFQALYTCNKIAPIVLAIIQPGSAFGGGWTRLESDDGYFKKTVTENPAGLPGYLLYGGQGGPHFYEQPCWHEYNGDPIARLAEDDCGLWRRSLP